MNGMCHQRHRDRHHQRGSGDPYEWSGSQPAGPVAVSERDPDERVTDVDRERAAALLSQAFRDGILRVEEFDQRLSAVYAAQTVAAVETALRDLPAAWLSNVKTAEEAQQRSQRYAREWRAGFAAYRNVMMLLVAIWFVTNLNEFTFLGRNGDTSFWPIWPMLGWGIGLLLSRPRGTPVAPPGAPAGQR